MNVLHITGNLTANPESRNVDTRNGPQTVCNFTVAANRHVRGKQMTEFFRITLWNKQGENAVKYLYKGRKVAVTGPVTARAYVGKDGKPHCSMEISDVKELEYMDSRPDAQEQTAPGGYQDSGYTEVEEDELPFDP